MHRARSDRSWLYSATQTAFVTMRYLLTKEEQISLQEASIAALLPALYGASTANADAHLPAGSILATFATRTILRGLA